MEGKIMIKNTDVVQISQQDAKKLIKLCEYFIDIGEGNIYDDEEHLLAYSEELAPELRTKSDLAWIVSKEAV